jgi:hypothetical protein
MEGIFSRRKEELESGNRSVRPVYVYFRPKKLMKLWNGSRVKTGDSIEDSGNKARQSGRDPGCPPRCGERLGFSVRRAENGMARNINKFHYGLK